jgi:hypothetical protein
VKAAAALPFDNTGRAAFARSVRGRGKSDGNLVEVTLDFLGSHQELKSESDPADLTSMDPSTIALQGLQQANTQLDAAASAIASAGATSANGNNPDVVDLSTEMVALMSAQTSFSANLATLETVDQMQKTLLDVTA